MAATSPIPGEVLGHFRLVEQIGAGGMGIVFRAHDLRLQRDVAVKILNPKTLSDPSGRRRFRREALVLSRLNHPNVESVYEFPSDQGVDYIVMEFVPGTSLDDRLERGPIPEAEAINLAVQLARGLAAAHARGIIHRDLKPGNLRVTPENVLKILDFGLSQLFALPDDETVTETVANSSHSVLGGTLPYMAPEQLQGKPPDARSDVYSAGCVLYEMVTGSRPFSGRGLVLHDAILCSQPPPPRQNQPDLSPDFESVILKCLEKDPNARYQSASELLAELARVAADQDISVKTERWSRKRTSRRTIWGSAAAVVVLAAIAIGAFLFRPPHVEAHQKIMAVLPFDAIGQNSATSALGAGLMETVATKLVEVGHDDTVQVVSPHELNEKGVKSAADARREFGTDMVLEGSLQESGNELRITCNLVDSKTGRQIGARTITRNVNDIFNLQDETVNAALDMLASAKIKLQPQTSPTHPDTSPAAYEAYIRGRGYLEEYEKPENIDNAIADFNQVLKIDPNYVPAYAGLGEAYWIGYDQLNKGESWLAKASDNCRQAVSLNPQTAEGQSCLGNVSLSTGKYEEAVALYQRALKLNPESGNTLGQLALAYEKLGNSAAAEPAFKQAVALRPSYWAVYNRLGAFYYNQGQYSKAAEMFQKVTGLAPDNYVGYCNLGGAYLLLGRYDDAIIQLKRSIDLRPNVDAYSNLGTAYFALRHFAAAADNFQQGAKLDDHNWINWGNLGDALYWTPGRRSEAAAAYRSAISLAQAKLDVNPRDANIRAIVASYYAMLGERAQALKSLQEALKLAPKDPDVAFRAAIVYMHAGDTDRCLSWIKTAVDEGFSRPSIRDLPDFDPLQNNPKFRALVVGS
ncbi:MAG: tetratricopeptide repeat protein [Candidatus Korobacteraceae bacterium]